MNSASPNTSHGFGGARLRMAPTPTKMSAANSAALDSCVNELS